MSVAGDRPRVLITGAGDGAGFACACAFAERGAEVILCDIDGVALTRANDLVDGFARYCDVVSEASIAVFAAEIADTFPSLDVIVNAAGRGYVRSLGMMRVSQALLPLVRRARGRRFILNVAPAGGFALKESMFPYAGSREGFQRLSDALSDQVVGTGICVLAVTPRRRLNAHPPASDQPYFLERADDSELAERIVRTVAASRPGWRHHRVQPFNRRA
ncbi:SDR family oxidoreductase [Sphingomonas sp. URHD0057]|uniref:SDR family oxidoreductase n=1 Tax=Sphingomonas sp. URHD0057 TaxID=1380389 RepID=UPI000491A451|nr:SDR family oxidoreductase [Sphingomonas sp. URHD0057]